ncbi:MAG: class I SAM-dependent methyltransferase [Limnobacter sp.]|uniref:class I SAM-dependent methyltransferase n=1 Tax=Limnobacter sp. TaxID=2003368 RepID=UPI00391D2868
MNARHQSHIHAIRPKVLFKAIEERFPGQNIGFTVNIPSPDIGGMTLLESSVLVSLARLTGALRFFEFGTFMGATTLLLAQNSPAEAQVVTVDIGHVEATAADNAEGVLRDGNVNDAYLRQTFGAQGARCLTRADADTRAKVTQMFQDSTTLDVQQQGLAKRFDFIFIDGGHQYDIVRSDTEKAYDMASENAVIVWHDYASNIHADVTHFLQRHSQNHHLVHVENTMLVFELLGKHRRLIGA